MKKRFSRLTVFLSTLILAVIFVSGCSFVSSSSGKNDFYSAGDSLVAAQSVNFNTTAKTRDIEDAFIDAVEKVQRTSVMLKTETGAGSGVIVDMSFENTDAAANWKSDDNMVYIVTCHHMVSKENSYGVEGVGKITVYIPDTNCSYENADYIFNGFIGDGKPSEYKAENYAVTLVGGDFESDIALLRLDLDVAAKSGKKLSADKIEKAQIPYSTSASPYQVEVGETVFSVGNPTGELPGSVARGIVSYLSRKTSVSEVGNMTLMQIDVSTNPGSSGGGLYNLYGELIGITNAGNTNYTNINFAIPCYLEDGNGFVQIAEQLGGTATETNYGYVSGRRVKFGFTVAEGSDNGNSSLYVASVSNGSIAATAKLQQGDEIVSVKVTRGSDIIASENVTTVEGFGNIMNNIKAGDVIALDVKRTTYTSWGRPSTKNTTVEMTTKGFRFCNTGDYSGDAN